MLYGKSKNSVWRVQEDKIARVLYLHLMTPKFERRAPSLSNRTARVALAYWHEVVITWRLTTADLIATQSLE